MWRVVWFTLTLVLRAAVQSEVQAQNSKSHAAVVQAKSGLTKEDVIAAINQPPPASLSLSSPQLWRNTVTSNTRTWSKSPDGAVRIPYEISPQYDEQTCSAIQRGFKDFEKFTCIRFVARTNEEDFISIQPVHGCYASVGRAGGMQLVSLSQPCLAKGKGVVEHEIMHSLGFWHEHARSDRDKYIKIEWKNVWPGYEHNFLKQNTNNLKTKYDYGSILHYSRSAFSRNGQPTLTPVGQPGRGTVIGQRHRLSQLDLLKVNRLYNCTAQLGHAKREAAGKPCL
ncbi:astacin-like metalloendopeptidase [Amblyraja radiata]|uniref:astacin-like metalloendopeptidase n=1 Tax=Amblyraja radiata TaxID=386614 RepID=UPI00140240C7|nr:astacin-like metalloendopeptidase [Amblyraja radiata]